ncbi:MAG: hypothetical protein MUF73_15460 [Rhodobacteraceae bacterium]|nr:hypothetical protein [Paracoccaceae bacterium]
MTVQTMLLRAAVSGLTRPGDGAITRALVRDVLPTSAVFVPGAALPGLAAFGWFYVM